MPKAHRYLIVLIATFVFIFLTGCSASSASATAPKIVEAYLQALVDRDANKMTNLSCAAWESQAKVEYDSFTAVKLALKDLACKEAGSEGDARFVSCSGSIVASYGNEDLPIDVAGQTYKVVQESGEWRVCGYQK